MYVGPVLREMMGDEWKVRDVRSWLESRGVRRTWVGDRVDGGEGEGEGGEGGEGGEVVVVKATGKGKGKEKARVRVREQNGFQRYDPTLWESASSLPSSSTTQKQKRKVRLPPFPHASSTLR